MFTDLDTGAILDVVVGRRGATVTAWLAARPRWWRRRVQLVAIDMSSEFRAAIRTALPKARISVDHWHVVRLANEMVTKVRRRRVWELHARRGRIIDTPWKYCKLLTCAGDRLSVRGQMALVDQIGADGFRESLQHGLENGGDCSGTLGDMTDHPDAISDIIDESEGQLSDIAAAVLGESGGEDDEETEEEDDGADPEQ